VQRLYGLPDEALIDMGDFVGGMLKYAKRAPVPRITIAGGFAKMVKLGQGMLDLHSKRGAVDRDWLAQLMQANGATRRSSVLMRRAHRPSRSATLWQSAPSRRLPQWLPAPASPSMLSCSTAPEHLPAAPRKIT
jgi:cobalamin biosynthesis protein CbiD